MQNPSSAIISGLERVHLLRSARLSDPALLASVQAVKQFQHARFARDYADLLASARYADAARFFLEELYGPHDFAERDAEFSRVVPALDRLMTAEVMRTVADLIELHALTEDLDQEMAKAASTPELDEASYRDAWRRVGRPGDRERQLELLMGIGQALARHTRSAVLRSLLRGMRAPARAAGLGRLQLFLEGGFTAFTAIGGASEFLQRIHNQERSMIADYFLDKNKAQSS